MFLVLIKVAGIRSFLMRSIIFSVVGFLYGFWYWLAFCRSELLFECQIQEILLEEGKAIALAEGN